MRLFHISDRADIALFVPRPVAVPPARPAGREWLNGPLVWAIDARHLPMYLFPRDCPRILIWPTPETTEEDRRRWWGGCDRRMIAHIEADWFERFAGATLYRYTLPAGAFEALDDAGMWVACTTVEPSAVEPVTDLPAALAEAGVELRVMPSLTPLRDVWSSSLHASGIRLRNARDWQSGA